MFALALSRVASRSTRRSASLARREADARRVDPSALKDVVRGLSR